MAAETHTPNTTIHPNQGVEGHLLGALEAELAEHEVRPTVRSRLMEVASNTLREKAEVLNTPKAQFAYLTEWTQTVLSHLSKVDATSYSVCKKEFGVGSNTSEWLINRLPYLMAKYEALRGEVDIINTQYGQVLEPTQFKSEKHGSLAHAFNAMLKVIERTGMSVGVSNAPLPKAYVKALLADTSTLTEKIMEQGISPRAGVQAIEFILAEAEDYMSAHKQATPHDLCAFVKNDEALFYNAMLAAAAYKPLEILDTCLPFPLIGRVAPHAAQASGRVH